MSYDKIQVYPKYLLDLVSFRESLEKANESELVLKLWKDNVTGKTDLDGIESILCYRRESFTNNKKRSLYKEEFGRFLKELGVKYRVSGGTYFYVVESYIPKLEVGQFERVCSSELISGVLMTFEEAFKLL